MDNFIFQHTTKIIFGKNTVEQVGEHAKQYGKKILLHYGGNYAQKSGLLKHIESSFAQAGLEYISLGGVLPNPRLSLVHKGIKLCKQEGVDCIIAIGGGSVIDSAKAIAAGACYDGDVWDFYERKSRPQKALPLGTVLTIPGAGAEATHSTVLSKDDGKLKRAMGAPCLLPKFSILNPEVCYSIPPSLMACAISDMFAHMLERYFTRTSMTELTDRLLEGAMQALITVAPQVLKNPSNYDLCAEIMWIATMAHNGVLNTGRSMDWASHWIEHEISALYGIAHGAGLAIVFPAWMKYTRDVDVHRFIQLGTRVFGISPQGLTSTEIADKTIAAVQHFLSSLGLATTFLEADLPTNAFDEIAEKVVWGGPVGGFTQIDKDDVVAILQLAKE